MAKKLSKEDIERMAHEVRLFLVKMHCWIDVTIYFNGKSVSTYGGFGRYAYNDPEKYFTEENVDPRDYFKYVGDILSMSFEGDLCHCLNDYRVHGREYDEMVQNGLWDIFKKYGVYYELGDHWNLSVFPIGG